MISLWDLAARINARRVLLWVRVGCVTLLGTVMLRARLADQDMTSTFLRSPPPPPPPRGAPPPPKQTRCMIPSHLSNNSCPYLWDSYVICKEIVMSQHAIIEQ